MRLLSTTGAAHLLALTVLSAVPSKGFVGKTKIQRSRFKMALEEDLSSSSSSLAASSNPAPSLDAILWDMDGVLAETERDAHRVAFNKLFETNGLNTVWDETLYGTLLEVGGGKERMTAHWNKVGWPASLVDLDDEAKQQRVKGFHEEKTGVFNDLIAGGTIPLRPGVERLIDEAIDEGKTLAVCSTSNEKAVKNLVKTLLGDSRASKMTIFAGDVVANKKPSPDIYNLAVDTLNLDKTRCLIVEDSGIGWGAAKAAGIACVVTKSVYTAHEDFSGANLVVTDLDGTDGKSDPVTLASIESLLRSSSP